MALPINIKNLINGDIVESNRIEFKAGFNETPIVHTICAFANDIDNIGGGYIIIGIQEKDGLPQFPVKGIEKKDVDHMLKRLLELCHFIEPYYAPQAEPVLYDGKYIIVIWCPGGYGRPYKAPKDAVSKQSNKYYYIRKFSSSVIASSDEEKELFYISSTIPFDDRPNLKASVNDLDLNTIREHLRTVESSLCDHIEQRTLKELAEDMELLDGPPEGLKPRNVGILMFSKNPQKYFRNARIEIADMPDPTGNNMVEKVFTGPIQNQLQDSLLFIKNYILRERVIKNDKRAEAERIWNYPYRAVEEILSNAVYHRSYQIEEPITVRCTPDAMEITSFPGFDRSITDRDIQKGIIRGRIYRNRRIGDFLKELHLIEGRNTGFPNAYDALKKNGSDPLQFEMDDERRYLSVVIPVHPSFRTVKEEKNRIYQRSIEEAIGNRSLTLTEIALCMGYKGITKKMRDNIDIMVEKGTIQKRVENKKIVYSLTERV